MRIAHSKGSTRPGRAAITKNFDPPVKLVKVLGVGYSAVLTRDAQPACSYRNAAIICGVTSLG